jgi:AGZA family xanthine/uracil permease-like MFS transporter
VEILEKFFKLKENGTTVKTEIMAGITTFLAMAYILAVNPSMLGAAGMNTQGVFLATGLAAAIATIVMALLANYPIALASGMGLNAYFAYTICLGELADHANPWQIALTAVLVEGVIFIILSIFKFRETLVNTIPENLKHGITAGIGLFITFIGLQNAGIASADSATLVALGDVAAAPVALALIGVLLIGAMLYFNVQGAILWGILGTWILGIIAELCGWYVPNPDAGVYSVIPHITGAADFLPNFGALGETAFKFDFSYVAENFVNFLVIVFAFLFVDLFDTVGTLVGVASKGNMLDKDGRLPRVGKALMADAIGTVAGACLGTSTVTSYVESSAGVAQGGRTGLTSITTAGLFLVSLFLWPIFGAIPGFATAPALVVVGLFMMSNVLKMKFEGDMADVLGGFVAIIMMPFTYSIANGIMFGMLTWVVLKLIRGRFKEIHPVMYVVGALFVLRIVTLIF